MEKKKYICLNFGGCDNADAQPPIEFELPEGEDALCPECGKHNIRANIQVNGSNPGKIAKIGGLMVGLGVLGYFLYDYLGDKPKEKKDVTTTISTKTEQPKVKQSEENIKVDSTKVDVKPEPKPVEEKEEKEKVVKPVKTIPKGVKIPGSDNCTDFIHTYYVSDGRGGKRMVQDDDSDYCAKCGDIKYSQGHQYRIDCEPDGTRKIKLIK